MSSIPLKKVPKNRELPLKEATLFKSTLKLYESKEYKKGLKVTDQILKKFPEHGESMAMKGIFLCNLDKKEDGFVSVKNGLKHDMTSSICWHVYGLIYRSEKNYQEASKCYLQAMKLDNTNFQILRDYSLLQMQLRNYPAYIDAAHQILNLKPTYKGYWMGLVVAYHLSKDFKNAIKMLDSFYETVAEEPLDTESSEGFLYRNMIIEESGDYQKALKDLDMIENKVVDRIGWQESKARILLQLGRFEDAHIIYKVLYYHNPDNRFYLTKLFDSKRIEESSTEGKVYLGQLMERHPKSNTLLQLFIQNATDAIDLRVRLEPFIQHALRKGIPSLFNSIRYLYTDSWKINVVEEILNDYMISLTKYASFDDQSSKEDPTVLLWTLYSLSQHYSAVHDPSQAIKVIDLAIKHTPTLVELYMQKARILKHDGNLVEASNLMNYARELDLQDRFLNSKASKYFLRANNIEASIKTVALFTKKDIDPVIDLTEMQCFWFLTESAEANHRTKNYCMALKYYYKIDTIFSEINDDQFDFHSYSIRKCILRAYSDLIAFEDRLPNHPYFRRATLGMIQTLLDMHFEESNCLSRSMEELALIDVEKSGLEERSRKLVANAIVASNKMNEAKDSKVVNESKIEIDQDPLGLSYLKLDKLSEALRFSKIVTNYSPKCLEGWIASTHIFLAKGDYVNALRSLLESYNINKTSHLLLEPLFKITNYWNQNEPTTKDAEFVKVSLQHLFTTKMDPANLVQILESKDQSPDYQIKIAKIYMTFDRAECVRVVKKIVGASYAKEPKTCQVPIELVTVKEILEFLKKELKDDTLIKTWLDKANTLFSMSF